MGKLIQFQNLQRYCQEDPELASTILTLISSSWSPEKNREWNFIAETGVVDEPKQYHHPNWSRAINYAE